MFNVGDRVRLIRHDQYPGLVGLEGRVRRSGMEDASRSASRTAAGVSGAFYQVVCATRTLHDIPELWLRHSGGKEAQPSKGQPNEEQAPAAAK